MNDIRINGLTYRQTWRTCNKANCKCKQGEQHGPYWMSTDGMGQRKYVGKNLPEEVTATREQIRQHAESIRSTRSDIDRQIEALRAESQALSMLMVGGKPNDSQRKIIKGFGFESCLLDDCPGVTRNDNLVPSAESQAQQESRLVHGHVPTDEQDRNLVTPGQLIIKQENGELK